MKMISSTRKMSVSGVMLMSLEDGGRELFVVMVGAIGWGRRSTSRRAPCAMAARASGWGCGAERGAWKRGRELRSVNRSPLSGQLVGAQRHVERLLRDPRLEHVVEDHRLHRDRDAARGGDSAPPRSPERPPRTRSGPFMPNLPERSEDADDGAEESDERHHRAERPQHPERGRRAWITSRRARSTAIGDAVLPVRAIEGCPYSATVGTWERSDSCTAMAASPRSQRPDDLLVQFPAPCRETAQGTGRVRCR